MTDVTETATITPGSWRELLGPKNLGASTVLAGGVGAVRDQRVPHHQPAAQRRRRHRRPAVLRVGDDGVPGRLGGGGDHRAAPCWLGWGRGGPTCRASACSALGSLAVRGGPDHGAPAGGPRGAGRGGRAARRAWLCGHQFRAAAVVVDQGVGAGVGDVGSRHAGRSRGRRPVRPIRFVALGIRCARRS